jgi:predicted 3-demethylubiquinone-9 3-methyltransferase (glyoxalase superfamily)
MAAQMITPCLWFESEALQAAEFYTSVFPDSSIVSVQKSPVDTPGAKAGAVILVQFKLAGQDYQALNGGPHDKFNDAISMSVSCEDQAEVDRLWSALTADGEARHRRPRGGRRRPLSALANMKGQHHEHGRQIRRRLRRSRAEEQHRGL